MSEFERWAQAAWIAYRNEYARSRYLTRRQVASQMRRREFIAGFLAALTVPPTTAGEGERGEGC